MRYDLKKCVLNNFNYDINSPYKFFLIFCLSKHNVAHQVTLLEERIHEDPVSCGIFKLAQQCKLLLFVKTWSSICFIICKEFTCSSYSLPSEMQGNLSLFSLLYKLSCTFRITLMIWMKPVCILVTFESDGNICFLLNCRQLAYYFCSLWTCVYKQQSKNYQDYTGQGTHYHDSKYYLQPRS